MGERDRWRWGGTNLPAMRKEVVTGDGVLWRRRLLRFKEWGGEKIGSLCEFDEKWGREVNKA